MPLKPLVTHRFKVTPKRASEIQQELRQRLDTTTPIAIESVSLVAGADVSYLRGEEKMFAAVTVLTYPELEIVESRWGSAPVVFPYVPGLLAFREAPVMLGVLRRLVRVPDVILYDAHGFAHPRGMGLASHMGVLLGVPSVGVAKSVLVGEYEMPGAKRGASTPLVYEGQTVGRVLRTRDGVRPVFVSVGHMADLETATKLVLSCCAGYRLPEPTRKAHALSNEARLRR